MLFNPQLKNLRVFVFLEPAMPTKEQVRKWQQERVKSHRPPPSPKEIRRQLGWDLIEMERMRRSEKVR